MGVQLVICNGEKMGMLNTLLCVHESLDFGGKRKFHKKGIMYLIISIDYVLEVFLMTGFTNAKNYNFHNPFL